MTDCTHSCSSSTLTLLNQIINIFEIDRYPFISIILPIYNAQNYIINSINSIINQTYLNWELIIINDGSTDDSIKIIENNYLNDNIISKKIKLISLKENKGIVNALNKGILECNKKTKYIARMDADDISLNDRIEIQIKFMINNPNIDILGTGVHLFNNNDNNNEIIKTITYKCFDTISIKWSCLFFCPLNHPTVMFKYDGSFKINYDNTYNHCEDYHLWFKLLFQQKCNFANLNGAYLKLRKNQKDNISNKYHDKQYNDSIKLVRDYISKQISLNVEINVIDCIRNPKKIKTLSMFKKCYNLLEKWEKYILKDNFSLFVKNDCDLRMAELISLCMKLFIIDAIKMMQKWKLRKPNFDLKL